MEVKKRLTNSDLLSMSIDEKENYFKNFSLPHPYIKRALNALLAEINSSSQHNIVMVIGPSGVGKSRLMEETLKVLEKEMATTTQNDRSIIPIVGIELPNPDLGKFNWKDFYYRVLTGLEEPLIDDKVDIERYLKGEPKPRISTTNSGTAPELRRSIEKATQHRKTKALLIDEGQHFFKTANAKFLESQFNSIKSLANMSKAKIVMFGTYELNSVINLDGQLSRRVIEIHFPRYDILNKNDKKVFLSIINIFQQILPLKDEPNLIRHYEYIYEYSLGCCGILKKWLQRCLNDVLYNGENTITLDVLERNALNPKKIIKLAKEAIKGEQAFIINHNDEQEIKDLLGTSINNDNETKVKKKGNQTPGRRKPKRDLVGGI